MLVLEFDSAPPTVVFVARKVGSRYLCDLQLEACHTPCESL
jgi:hypothetical protein